MSLYARDLQSRSRSKIRRIGDARPGSVVGTGDELLAATVYDHWWYTLLQRHRRPQATADYIAWVHRDRWDMFFFKADGDAAVVLNVQTDT